MYACCGDEKSASLVFKRIENLNVFAVNRMVLVSAFNGNFQEAIGYSLMRDSIKFCNKFTYSIVLKACAGLLDLRKGKEVHGMVNKMCFDSDVSVGNALVGMYCKCGHICYARKVFDKMPNRVVQFERMQEEGIQADVVTFISVLSACSHGGSFDKGLNIFRFMKERHGVEITKEHYNCIVDMLCRSGRMIVAYEFVREMPIKVTDSIVGAFFNSCKVHGRKELAKMMTEETLRMDLKRPGGFVTLSNIYAADGEWHEVQHVRKVKKENNVHKKPGYSWVEKRDEFVGQEVSEESSIQETRGGLPCNHICSGGFTLRCTNFEKKIPTVTSMHLPHL